MDESSKLVALGVQTLPGHRLVSVNDGTIINADHTDIQIDIPCDAMVCSLSVRASETLSQSLSNRENVFVVSEAQKGEGKSQMLCTKQLKSQILYKYPPAKPKIFQFRA